MILFGKTVIDMGGGVVLYVRDNIPFSERKDLISKDLEMVCTEINRPNLRNATNIVT